MKKAARKPRAEKLPPSVPVLSLPRPLRALCFYLETESGKVWLDTALRDGLKATQDERNAVIQKIANGIRDGKPEKEKAARASLKIIEERRREIEAAIALL